MKFWNRIENFQELGGKDAQMEYNKPIKADGDNQDQDNLY